MALTRVNPDDVFFTFSRLRPKFSCGRRVEDTLASILAKELRPEDLPPIGVLLDPATGHLFSLNNRRLYVFKALKAAGKLKTIPVRLKPVPQTKRMKDKYTAEKCAKIARLMLEKEAVEALGSDDEAEGVNTDNDNDDNDTDESGGEGDSEGKKKKEGPTQQKPSAAKKVKKADETNTSSSAADAAVSASAAAPAQKYVKPVRNMDDWTDEEDNGGGGKNKKGQKGTRKK